MKFEDLGVYTSFVERLTALDVLEPTAIQQVVIPKLLERKSLLAASQTGSGKTLAYLLPLLQLLSSGAYEKKIDMVILLPTRELARQVADVVQMLCIDSGVTSAVIYGGVPYQQQIDALAALPSVLIATVGRLKDLLSQGVLELYDVEYFVLDEVDQMLDLGFGDSVLELAQCRKEGGVSCFFSATVGSDVCEVVDRMESDLDKINIATDTFVVDDIVHSAYYVERRLMCNLLLHILRSEKPKCTIVFTRSRNMADMVTKQLCDNGMVAESFHSERSQSAREYILARFKSGETPIVVATDVMSRGIDLDNVECVINYGLPQSAELYIHRVGRTGRAGRSGKAISMCEPTDYELLGSIQKMMKRSIPITTNHPYHTQEVTKVLSGLYTTSATQSKTKAKAKSKSKGKR